ncbi:hypothetical protein MYX82_03775 [Acidobacteria bacterium AH-259-D05]|nr:hypothetical protein [Acidobacteria bacterium AH-259-D05]
MKHQHLTITDTMQDSRLFSPWFKADSWDNWKVFLKALFGLPMLAQDMRTFTKYTGRENRPEGIREAWLPVGRRGGKSLIAALVAVFLACFRNYSKYLGPGERITIMIIAADRKQARVVMRYIVGFLEGVAMLESLVERKTQETVDLSNRVTIEVHTTSYRSVRGYSLGAVICDEVAFWRSDDSASPDREIIAALRPGMASIPGSLLLAISSPYARRGMLWQMYSKHYGKDTPVLVWQAPTEKMNPSIDPEIIREAYEDDPISAAAEYGAEFRRDIEAFIPQEAVEAVVVENRKELLPAEDIRYFGFVDPSGGSQDSFTLAISHLEGDVIVLDALRERVTPFSPRQVVEEFSQLLRQYRITQVSGDRYGGQFPRELFKEHGIDYRPSDKVKSEIYIETLALLNSESVELLDHQRLITQLCSLERRTSRSGRDSIDHPPHSKDDIANSVCGAVLLAKKPTVHDPAKIVIPAMRSTPEERARYRDTKEQDWSGGRGWI